MANEKFDEAAAVVTDAQAPLDARIRALYILKEFRKDHPAKVAEVLIQATDRTDSVLLQHEFLYNVGQIGLKSSNEELKRIINDPARYDVVSRHEAIESMGAIADQDTVEFLKATEEKFKEEAPIRESCELAIRRLEKIAKDGAESVAVPENAEFVSVDPAPAADVVKTLKPGQDASAVIGQLGDLLSDEKASLWERYEAMFALRNIGGVAAVEQLGRALRGDTSSCLFRHEVAFVLGQLEHPASSAVLTEALVDEKEHPMVRHEAAEALGAVAAQKDWDTLTEYAKDHHPAIVRDSCLVALDMHAYWSKYKTEEQKAEAEAA